MGWTRELEHLVQMEKDPKAEEGDEVDLEKEESTVYRGLAARLIP